MAPRTQLAPLPHAFIIDTNALLHNQSYDYYNKQYQKQLNVKRLQRRSTVHIQKTRRNTAAQGDEIIEKIRALLDNGFGVLRSEIQVKIHKAFLEACLPKIYQGAWDENKPRILREFALKKLMQEVLVVMPRRRGKTYATAMMAAALILTVPDISVAVFSTGMFCFGFCIAHTRTNKRNVLGERTARMLMGVVRDMIERAFNRGVVSREDYQIDTDNKEMLVYIGPDGTKRVLGCYPGSVKVSFFYLRYDHFPV